MPKPVTTDSGKRPRARSRAAQATGFTIIELMLALTVLGILAALALPSLSDLVKGQRVKSASSDVYASLIYARSEAIKRAADVTVVPNTTDWAAGWKVKDGAGTDLKIQDAIPGVTVGPAAATITFRRDGRIGGTATVEFILSASPANAKVTARCVQISLSGRPNIRSDSNGNAADGCQ